MTEEVKLSGISVRSGIVSNYFFTESGRIRQVTVVASLREGEKIGHFRINPGKESRAGQPVDVIEAGNTKMLRDPKTDEILGLEIPKISI